MSNCHTVWNWLYRVVAELNSPTNGGCIRLMDRAQINKVLWLKTAHVHVLLQIQILYSADLDRTVQHYHYLHILNACAAYMHIPWSHTSPDSAFHATPFQCATQHSNQRSQSVCIWTLQVAAMPRCTALDLSGLMRLSYSHPHFVLDGFPAFPAPFGAHSKCDDMLSPVKSDDFNPRLSSSNAVAP